MIDVSAEVEACRQKIQRTYRITFLAYAFLFGIFAVAAVTVNIWYYSMFFGLPLAWASGWAFNQANHTR